MPRRALPERNPSGVIKKILKNRQPEIFLIFVIIAVRKLGDKNGRHLVCKDNCIGILVFLQKHLNFFTKRQQIMHFIKQLENTMFLL